MRIHHPGILLQTQRLLNQSTQAIARSLRNISADRLPVRAGDDIVALSQMNGYERSLRGIAASIQNVNLAKGFLTAAEAALQAQTDLIQRMRELGVQASQSSLSASQRASLQEELQSLLQEFERISTSSFGGRRLLDGSLKNLEVQVGKERGQSLSLSLGSTLAKDLFRRIKVTDETNIQVGAYSGNSNSQRLADFNNNGIMDLVIGRGAAGVRVKFGNGDGTFGEEQIVVASAAGFSMAIADFNGNGNQDIAAISTGGTKISLFHGNGQGDFSVGAVVDIPFNARLKAGDVNGNGHMDIVGVAASGAIGFSLLNNGDGTFAAATTFALPGVVSQDNNWALADLDGNGRVDLVVNGVNGARVLMNDGLGGFTQSSTVGNDPFSFIRLRDLNGNGIKDLIAIDFNSASIKIAMGQGDGSFGSVTTYESPNPEIGFDLEVLDLNGNGKLDIVFLSSPDYEDINLYILEGLGDGKFKAPQFRRQLPDGIGNTLGTSEFIGFGDFTQNGALDFLVSGIGGSSFMLGLGRVENVSALDQLNFKTAEQAQKTLSLFDQALETILKERSRVGSLTNRLESIDRQLLLHRETTAEAQSRVGTPNLAELTSELVRNQILQQAQIAVLSQINLQAQAILSLLDSLPDRPFLNLSR
ncbi:MAG: hypothetical protein EA369_00515 [Bradymonadales bacterium]|nr:MAG: hypothetical protein EA369_00515 [Bradymonadales bacterium]